MRPARGRRRAAAAAAALVALWLSSDAVAAPSFSPPRQIAGPVASLALAAVPTGEVALAWADTQPGPYYGAIPVTGIGVARRESPSEALSVSQLFNGSATYPHVAASAEGALVTFVAVPPGSAPPPPGSAHGYASWAPPHAPFGALEPLPDGFGDGPVVFAPSGNAVIFGSRNQDSPAAGKMSMFASLTRSGQVGPASILASGDISPPVVAAGGGKIEALWMSSEPPNTPNQTVYASDVTENGASARQALSTPSTRPLASPSLVIDGAGDMVAVWESGAHGMFPARSLAIAVRPAGSSRWRAPVAPVRGRFAALFPTVTISRDGRFAVVYNDGPRLAVLTGAVHSTEISRELIPHAKVGVAVTQPALFVGHGGLVVLDRFVADGHPLRAFYRARSGHWFRDTIERLGVINEPAAEIESGGHALIAFPRIKSHFQGELDVVTCKCG